MAQPRAVFAPLKQAVLLSIDSGIIFIDAHRCPALIAFLRAWPLGACGMATLTNKTGCVIVRDWQADDVANALVIALEAPILAASLSGETR
jgi:hypothetical protein